MFAGLGAARVRRLFRIARQHEPSIIFIDELDAVGGQRGFGLNNEKDQTLNQLLIEMDGFRSSDRLVVIAASNLLDRLDAALLRPGRFDRQIYVSPPDVARAREILRVHCRDKPVGDVDLDVVARQTSGLTGADLANICNEAAIFARAARRRRGSSPRTSTSALERVIAGTQSRRVLNDHEKRVVAYHEAGHALCAELLPAVDRVHHVSIVPRGPRARLHAEPARRGPLPQDARGADRLHDDAARRPRRRADRVRRGHDRRLRRPAARVRDRRRDDHRLRDGDDGLGHRRAARRPASASPSRPCGCATRSARSSSTRRAARRSRLLSAEPHDARRARRGAAGAGGARARDRSSASSRQAAPPRPRIAADARAASRPAGRAGRAH